MTIMKFVETMRRLGLEDDDILYTSSDVELAYIDYVANAVGAIDVE